MNSIFLKKVLELYILEDSYFSDITTEAIGSNRKVTGTIRAKEDSMLAGSIFIDPLFQIFGRPYSVEILKNEGEWIKKGETIAKIEAEDKVILTAERICLNILQRLSGIATKTRNLSNLIKDYKAEIVDTRKTTPGFRFFEKYAVKVGGGVNHRIGLFDAALIKDNHIKAAGSIKRAIEMVKRNCSFTTKIEVECENEEMVTEAIENGADIVMLDNMSVEDMSKINEKFKEKAIFEASGNIDENNIVDVAKTGVDFISLGSLTHHACWVDINMKLE